MASPSFLTAGPVAPGPANPSDMSASSSSIPPSSRPATRLLGGSQVIVLPHIDDLTSFPLQIDRNLPIRKVLDAAWDAMMMARTMKEFNRPAQAMTQYITASVIALEIIPHHKEFVTLKSDRKNHALGQRYDNLLNQIKASQAEFEKLKADIMADNARTGVQPTTLRSTPATNNQISSPPGKPASLPSSREMSSSPDPPNGKSTFSPAGPSAEPDMLWARFSKLGGPASGVVQDPRINTRPIEINKPLASRPSTSQTVPQARPPVNLRTLTVPKAHQFPKIPEAIYSPSRGAVSNEAINLPSSNTLVPFSRSASEATINLNAQSATANGAVGRDQLSLDLVIPDGPTLSPEELVAVSQVARVLVIDIRDRERFDEGHIMSQAIICLEPSVLMRGPVSADQIAESNVLSPAKEQLDFEKRDKFDLLVLYDQSSASFSEGTTTNPTEMVLSALFVALTQFNYGRELKRAPKLLKGGLDAWIDTLGSMSLQLSTTVTRTKPSAASVLNRRSVRYVAKPLQPEEVKAFQEALKEELEEIAASPAFHRTPEQFIRRFPPVAAEKESMISPMTRSASYDSYQAGQTELFSDLPTPPLRPAPAVPRRSHNRFNSIVPADSRPLVHGYAAMAKAIFPATAAAQRPLNDTGLFNPRNWCYANATIQALRTMTDFQDEFINGQWQTIWAVPRRPGERIDQPQLMMKILSNLFHWMSTGQFPVMRAQTLMDYSRHLSMKNLAFPDFGGNDQQDAAEYIAFLFEQIHDETNGKRSAVTSLISSVPPGPIAGSITVNAPMLEMVHRFWTHYSTANTSLIDRCWRGVTANVTLCNQCQVRTVEFEPFHTLLVSCSDDDKKVDTLMSCFRQEWRPELLSGATCDGCKQKDTRWRKVHPARLPDHLMITLKRFRQIPDGSSTKSLTTVTWDFNTLDLSPYFFPEPDCHPSVGGSSEHHYREPFHYECQAVICHRGRSLTAGHYLSYIRDPFAQTRHGWLLCNDQVVTQLSIGSGLATDRAQDVYRNQDAVPYIMLFRRKWPATGHLA